MKDVHKKIRDGFLKLESLTVKKDLEFQDPRVYQLWALAQRANMTEKELESFKVRVSSDRTDYGFGPIELFLVPDRTDYGFGPIELFLVPDRTDYGFGPIELFLVPDRTDYGFWTH